MPKIPSKETTETVETPKGEQPAAPPETKGAAKPKGASSKATEKPKPTSGKKATEKPADKSADKGKGAAKPGNKIVDPPKPEKVTLRKRPKREKVYDKIKVEVRQGDKAITSDEMKKILGWKEVDGADYDFTDMEGKRIICENNINRPLTKAWAETISQDILNGNWRLNGESIIIGETAAVLSCQHRGIGLIFAEQRRTGAKESEYWKKICKEPCTIESVVVYGISEDSETTRTLDNVKPRTLADVLFCDPKLFGTVEQSKRIKICKAVDLAIRCLWLRTGAADAFSPKRTHSESLSYLETHGRVLKAAAHIHEEDEGGKISKYVSLGWATAMMYLMATSEDEGADKYRLSHNPTERLLSFSLWDDASDFWTYFAQGKLEAVRSAIAALSVGDGTNAGGTHQEKLAIISKAWALHRDGEKITEDVLELEYSKDALGILTLVDSANFDGIDLGDDPPALEEDEGTSPPTEAEIEEGKDKAQNSRKKK